MSGKAVLKFIYGFLFLAERLQVLVPRLWMLSVSQSSLVASYFNLSCQQQRPRAQLTDMCSLLTEKALQLSVTKEMLLLSISIAYTGGQIHSN